MTFVKSARELQARFLANSPTFSALARNIGGAVHRHILPLGCEIETLYPPIRNEAVEFFDRRAIKWWKSPRSGDDVLVPGPTRNLVSSQVACVNFLLPLSSSAASLTAMLRSLDDDIVNVALMEYDVPKTGLRCSSMVEMECQELAPAPVQTHLLAARVARAAIVGRLRMPPTSGVGAAVGNDENWVRLSGLAEDLHEGTIRIVMTGRPRAEHFSMNCETAASHGPSD